MGIFGWVIMGLLAGMLARLFMPGRQAMGVFATILLGIVGALLGGFIGTRLGWGTVEGFDLRSLLLAIGGGILVLFIVGRFRKAS